MKKLFVGFLVILLLIGGAAYLLSGWILVQATDRALPVMVRMLGDQGIEVSDVAYERVGLAGLTGAVWKDIEATVNVSRTVTGYSRERFRVRLGSLSVKLLDFSLRNFELGVTGLEAGIADDLSSDFNWASERFKEAARNGRLRADLVSFPVSVDRADPKPDLKHIYGELTRLVREGETALPATIYAGVHTQLDGAPIGVRLKAVERGEDTALEVDRDDLSQQADHFSRPLTDQEIEVVAANPLRAPRLLFLKKYAESTADLAGARDKTVPVDAYRHVLWSYLLTQEYGPEFAEQVTDAHEIGSTTNTEADHRMDYNNNAVGRRYAAEGVRESEILDRVRTDRTVIRQPV